MTNAFEAIKLTDSVYWVGAIDWGVRNFHGYLTARGTTYNAFLVVADKVALIDTVKSGFGEEMMARIASVIDPSRIDYIISNHAELDHSGFLPQAIERLKPQKVFASKMGQRALEQHFHWDAEIEVVKTGDTLDLGNKTLRFIETRMIHWPDSLFTFLDDEGVLFSNDAFGMHLATSERFADEIDPSILQYEGAKYFANILLHLSPVVAKLLEELPTFNLDIKMIATDHGPLWRQNLDWIISAYKRWCAQEANNKAVLIFDTMWESTMKMARSVGDGLAQKGASVKLMPLGGCHRSDVLTEILEAGALIVGSPTINNQIYPTVADVMNYLEGLKPRNLVGAAFGSYGWSGEAVKHLDKKLVDMGVEVVCEGLRLKYVPSVSDLVKCRELGALVADRMAEKLK